MTKKIPDSNPTVRLSLGGVLLLGLAVLGVGIAGGFLANYFSASSLAPLPSGEDTLVTTVQEITISPNKAVEELVRDRERAVVLIGEEAQDGVFQLAGPGTVVTNDGLVVSVFNISGDTLVAFDGEGRRLPLHKVGSDPVFGLTYYQLTESVIQPFALADAVAVPGTHLLALSRVEETLGVSAQSYQVQNFALPPAGEPIGRQRLFEGAESLPEMFSGSPLIYDDGSLAGVLVDASAGLALTSADIRSALARVTTGQREFNAFTAWGFQTTYDFSYDSEAKRRVFTPTVTNVVPLSPAGVANLRSGDTLVSVNGTDVTWETNVHQLLAPSAPVTLEIVRGDSPLTLVLNPS